MQIDVNQFVAVVGAYKPTIAECLCDTIPADGQRPKRIRKSVDRTLKFLDEYFEAVKEQAMVKRLRYRGPFSGLFIVTHENHISFLPRQFHIHAQ